MSRKLFVGGLDFGTTDLSLQAAFSPYGTVIEAKVVLDRDTGRSRGFGFVTFEDEDQARAALDAMAGAPVDGRPVRVDLAEEKRGGPPRRGPRQAAPPPAVVRRRTRTGATPAPRSTSAWRRADHVPPADGQDGGQEDED